MLNGDLFLKNGATVSRRSKKWNQGKGDCSDTSFHFIAFVPIDGKVWKLDGLERQPQSIGMGTADLFYLNRTNHCFGPRRDQRR